MTTHTPDWSRLVAIDLETYYDQDYTLKKLSTSEYVRDPRFRAQMLGIRIGNGKTRTIPHAKIPAELSKINWATHSLLCHNTAFDGLILSHHYGVVPAYYYDTLSMARGLHSNEIGAGLDEVSIHYGGAGKLEGILDQTQGVLEWSKELFAATAPYCANDVDEMIRVFKLMLPQMPSDEMDLINLTCRMFCDPVLRVDIPRVEAELKRELDRREELLSSIVDLDEYDMMKLLKGKERNLEPKERDMLMVKRIIGSAERFAELLRAEGIEPPTKISPAWMKLPKEERENEEGLKKKYTYAFAKDDHKFTDLPNRTEDWGFDLNDPSQVEAMVAKQERVQALVDSRIITKSTTNVTRAERFLKAGADGMPLPVGYAYYRAHTGRFGGTNKMNFQNLPRGGELRLSILAPKGHMIAVADSGQIEARVNAWLWGQNDLLEAFRAADNGTGRDAYCNFADHIYGRTITKADAVERQVGKVAVLGLGYQMGAAKFQMTLAKSKIYFELDRCKEIVTTYREVNARIANGWRFCDRIINDMFAGRAGHHGPIAWEKETIYLPNGMRLKYPDLKKTLGDDDYPEWTYQSKDSRKKMYGGLLCLGASTQVLTDRGWLSIIEVRQTDKLWDGTNWVEHSGLVFQGVKKTIDFGGVDMTPDHEVLVDGDWYAAEETTHNEATSSFTRHHRTPDGYDDRNETVGQRWKKDSLVHNLRLRADENTARLRVLEGQHKELRVLDQEVYVGCDDDSWDVTAPSISCLAGHVGSVQVTDTSGVGEIRRTRHNGVRTLEKVRRVLGGHGRDLPEGSGPGSDRQHAGVQPRKLQMDGPKNKRPQHQSWGSDRHTSWRDALVGGSRGVRGRKNDASLPQRRRMACAPNVRQTRPNEQAVFDLVSAGPLKRFTVRGTDGKPFIVHNCENIIQALARIIVMWQMLQIDKKYRVVMTTHDEVACIVKKAQAQKCMDYLSQCMRTPPDWCLDLPLNSEGKVDVNYSK